VSLWRWQLIKDWNKGSIWINFLIVVYSQVYWLFESCLLYVQYKKLYSNYGLYKDL
jgi:hypothetical protein